MYSEAIKMCNNFFNYKLFKLFKSNSKSLNVFFLIQLYIKFWLWLYIDCSKGLYKY